MKSKRKAISPIIATLILIVITVIAGIFLYSFVSGYLGTLSSTTSTPANVQITPINVTSTSYPTKSATLYVTITNAGTSPVALSIYGSLYFSNGTLAGSATIVNATPYSAFSSTTNTVSVAPGRTIVAKISLSTTSPYEINTGYIYYIKLTTSTGYVEPSSTFIP